MEVYNKGSEYWGNVILWADQRRLLTFDEQSILKLAAGGKILFVNSCLIAGANS